VQLNYFIAPELGGLGLNPPPGSFITSNPDYHKPNSILVTGSQRKLADYLYPKWTEFYTTPPAGPVGSPKKTNDLTMLDEVSSTQPLTREQLSAFDALMANENLSALAVSGKSRKRLPPVEKRIVRRLVETSGFIISGARLVPPQLGGCKNVRLNELSDKDMLKLSYTWQMPAWKKTFSVVPKLSPASLCKKEFIEVTTSVDDICIPELFCY
jgi:hypothetical protein